ncbi:MAG: hypothetical protein ACPGJV_03995 [Bacteriovoracaceae bacterium]
MKYLIKLLALHTCLCFSAQAREIFVITHSGEWDKAKLTKEVLIDRYSIPKEFIGIKSVKDKKKVCHEVKESIYHFCFDGRGEFKIVKTSPSHFRNALRVFHTPIKRSL